jgi:hypothetical protein
MGAGPGAVRNSRLTPILGKVATQKWFQRFLAMPSGRRLQLLRLSAGGFGFLALLLLLLLLWPRSVPVIVRSDPDQAEVLRNGESLGTTPLVVELKKGVRAKLILRKEGYVDAEQDVEGGGEKVVLVSLSEKSSSKPSAVKKPVKPAVTPDDDGGEETGDSAGPGEGSKSDGTGEEIKKKKRKKKKKVVVF